MTVYVVQQQMFFDKEKGELCERFDFSSAAKFGKIKTLLSPSASPFYPDDIIEELHNKLKNFAPNDYLLLVGNPILIGIVTAIASNYSPVVNFLQWSGKKREYISVRTDIFLVNHDK